MKRNHYHLIIDSSSLTWAAFYAFGTDLSYSGEQTGIVYGFLSKLLTIGEKFKTNNIYFCWDHKKSLRKEVYPEYKIRRKKKQKEATESEKNAYISKDNQVYILRRKVLPNIGFKNLYQQPGYESDDLMAYLLQSLKNKEVIMVTSDNDMYQCLNDCTICSPTTMKKFTKKDFMAKYKVDPSQWPICKSIGGCDGDDVIGIKGVADPKKETSGALKYVRGEVKRGSALMDKIESKEGRKIAKRNLPLVTLPYQKENLRKLRIRKNKFTKEKLIKTFSHYGFKSFLNEQKFARWEDLLLRR